MVASPLSGLCNRRFKSTVSIAIYTQGVFQLFACSLFLLHCNTDGGANIDAAKMMFGYILGNGTFPTPAYFSVDNMDAFYLPNLDAMVTSLLELVNNTANSDSVSNLVYDGDTGHTFNQADMMNSLALIDVLLVESQIAPKPTDEIFIQVLTELRDQVEAVTALDFTDPATQYAALDFSGTAVGMMVSLDFFNPAYPESEAYSDQTFTAPTMTGPPGAPPQTTSSSKRDVWSVFAWSLFVGAWALAS